MSNLGAQEHEGAAAAISRCLDPDKPQSFFLYAGAGSGKTRSLVDALDQFRKVHGDRFRFRGQIVSVITYTNAACDEIKRRLNFDPIIQVSTIHSFVWELIKGFNADIRKWLEVSLKADIDELQELIANGRPGTKAMLERERSVKSKTDRLNGLASIKAFTYSPTGDNRTRDSLNHSEVIKIGSAFLNQKSLMRKLVVSGSPFILVDESQDTNRDLMEALLALQRACAATFGLGLFGDMMQRIYADGKADLGQELPADWSTPQKTVNFRCPKKVIRLINHIRAAADGWQQVPSEGAADGCIRLFILPTTTKNKQLAEQSVRQRMAEITGDAAWKELSNNKTLILEHHMAAKRMGFLDMYEPLNKVDQLQTGLREGTIGFLRFFSDQVLPVVNAQRKNDAFGVGGIVRRYSPLLATEAFRKAPRQQDQLIAAKAAVTKVTDICDPEKSPTFQQVLNSVAESNLFEIPEALYPFVEKAGVASPAADEDDVSDLVLGIRQFLKAPFYQIELYARYVTNLAPFGTHQGVKGLEFPRVMVIMDDDDARGFMFSYEKLFGIKERTKTDIDNEKGGKETSIDRTRRLLYVTCSRSEQSLALVAYTSNAAGLKNTLTKLKWFEEDEVELLEG